MLSINFVKTIFKLKQYLLQPQVLPLIPLLRAPQLELANDRPVAASLFWSFLKTYLEPIRRDQGKIAVDTSR